MLEKLMDPERAYGEPQYTELSKQISVLQAKLQELLDDKSRDLLEQLSNAYIRQGNAMLPDAFADGFWTAAELALEWYKR